MSVSNPQTDNLGSKEEGELVKALNFGAPESISAISSPTAGNEFKFLDSAEERLYYRYGFKASTLAPRNTLASTSQAAVWASHLLGDPQWTEKSVIGVDDRDMKDDVCSFVGYLSKAKKLEDIPAELYELRQHGAAALRPSPIQLRWEIITGITYYFLTSKNLSPDATLLESIVVRSAASALEILRRGWTTMEQVALNLVSRGIAFNTFSRALPPSYPVQQHVGPLYRGLGFRPRNFQAHVGEYAGYEVIRNRMFNSARGRAALLMGGVISRLARDVISLQSVCSGPTKNIYVAGQYILDGHPASPAYWDDAFTEEELDIICGVYEVATGQVDSGSGAEQTECGSWWPPPGSWALSGLNTGHWTPACETWFQQRLAQIRTGDAQLLSQTEWKNKLKGDSMCLHLSQNNDRLAEEFLVGNGTRVTRDPQAHQFGIRIPSNTFYFVLRTQDPESTSVKGDETVSLEPSKPKSALELPPREKPSLQLEIQQVTRQYWDSRRKITSSLLRGRIIEDRLRTLHVENPDDIYLNSAELAQRLKKVETELAEERRRAGEAENILKDIRRECKTPTVVPQLLLALIKG